MKKFCLLLLILLIECTSLFSLINKAEAFCPNVTTYGSLGSTAYSDTYGRGSWDNYAPLCYSGLYGVENIIRFTPLSSGFFNVQLNSSYIVYYNLYLFIRPTKSSCDSTGFTCLYRNANYFFTIGPLNAGATYDLMIDSPDTSHVRGINYLVITCPQPSNVGFADIQPTSLNITWNCDCSTTYLEYGPLGFTPGTGATAGANGTLISNVTTPYTLSGLTPGKVYDFYLRSYCGGYFSTNTSVVTHRTAPDCSSAPVLSCSDTFSYKVTSSASAAMAGAWQLNSCFSGTKDLEKVFRFTPTQSGYYSILAYSICIGSSGYNYRTGIYIKPMATCNENGWTCCGMCTYSPTSTFKPTTISLGNLSSGVTYSIMIQGYLFAGVGAVGTWFFRLECPNFCTRPIISYYQLNCSLPQFFVGCYDSCDSCFGDITLEYGLAGFTPGNDSTPGNGGAIIQNVIFPYTLNGLLSSTTYDVYARQKCSQLSAYSINSPKLSFTTDFAELDLKLFTQGYYLTGGTMKKVLYNERVDTNSSSLKTDTAFVELHGTTSPFALVESFKGVVQTDGTLICSYPCPIKGNSYYVAVRHRNTIQTWSAMPVVFTTRKTSYDFTTAATKAYGNNMIQMETGRWAFYTGEINQDNNVDLLDFPTLDAGIVGGLTGYYASDLNGDGNVDIIDFPLLDANIIGGVSSIHP